MFNVSMNPFRRLTEKRRQNSEIGRTSYFAVSHKQPKLHDPEFSIDNFLSRLSTFRQNQPTSSTSNFLINDKPILPPKPKSSKFNAKNQNILSTKCFVEIFKRLPAKDLINLRLVCKDFNQIIQSHALEMDTVAVNQMEIVETSKNYFIRSETSRNLSKLMLEHIDRPLRHLKTNILDLYGITVSQKVMRYFLRSFKYQISTIKFTQCEFLISADKLARLINPWKPKSLEFYNCSWNLINEENETNFDQLFIDFFFSRHQSLDSLIIDFSKMPQQKLEISDKIAQIFIDLTKLPSNLIFRNCSTNISAKTLHNAIWSYIEAINSETTKILPKSFNWSFGQISDSEDTVASMLSRFSDYILTEKFEKFRLEIIFQVDSKFPVLNFGVEFEYLEELKNEEEDLSDIEWDESLDSDALYLSTVDSVMKKEITS